jgi:hypothetical protein
VVAQPASDNTSNPQMYRENDETDLCMGTTRILNIRNYIARDVPALALILLGQVYFRYYIRLTGF